MKYIFCNYRNTQITNEQKKTSMGSYIVGVGYENCNSNDPEIMTQFQAHEI